MSLIKKILFYIAISIISFPAFAEEVKKIGKFKDWEAMVLVNGSELVCFAQSKPVLQSPKTNPRDARLFVSFRPGEKISDEILNCEYEGILGTVAGIIGTIQANEILKKLLSIGQDLNGFILILDLLNLNFRKVKLKKLKNVPE